MSEDTSAAQWQPPPRPPAPQQPFGSSPWGTPPRPPAPVQPAPSPFAAPYATAPQGSFPEPAARRARTVGIIALVAAVLAAVGASVVGAIAGFQIGLGIDPASFSASRPTDDLSFLSPVRTWVLVAEIAFWVGTALGVWGLVQGIIGIVSARGRVPAIIGVIVAVLGPVVFFTAVFLGVATGAGAAATTP